MDSNKLDRKKQRNIHTVLYNKMQFMHEKDSNYITHRFASLFRYARVPRPIFGDFIFFQTFKEVLNEIKKANVIGL